MRKFILIFVALDAALALVCLLQGGWSALINTQIGAFSALAVALGSYMGYRHTIQHEAKKLEQSAPEEEPDTLEKIDDPHGLYDDEPVNEAPLSSEEVKQIFHEEKAKVKARSSVKNIFLTYRGIVSPFRLIAYGLLILGFFWLEGNGLLLPLYYLLGLSLLPLTSVVASFRNR